MNLPFQWIRRAVSSAHQRAKKRGLPFNITAQDMVGQWKKQQGRWYWSNVPVASMTTYHITLSRHQYQGYVYGNAVWACLAANTAKRDTDPDAWEDFLDLLLECLPISG